VPRLADAIKLLAKSQSDQALYLLVRIMTGHEDIQTRLRALQAIGHSRSIHALTALLNMLEDDQIDYLLRRQAFRMMQRIVQPYMPHLHPDWKCRLLALLQKLLYAEDDDLHEDAIRMLSSINTPETRLMIFEWQAHLQVIGSPYNIRIFR
jgi:HEAT repeat protein